MNCGTYNPIVKSGVSTEQGQALWGGSQPQVAYSSGQSSDPQWGQVPVFPQQTNQWGQSPAFPQNNGYVAPATPAPPSLNNYYGLPGQTQQSGFNTFNQAPQQNAYYLAPYVPVDYNLSPQKKRGPRVGLIVGLILLVIILVGSAFGGYTYYQHRNQSNNVPPTPVKVMTPTIKPLFGDSFNNNNTGWDLTSKPGKFSVKVGGSSMILEDDDNKLLWEVLPGKSLTDFRLDVDAKLSKGDPNNGYGVYIRGASSQNGDLETYYRFELYGDGTYAIFKGYLDASGHMQSFLAHTYTSSATIAKAGATNHITIVAKGSTMVLMINNQTIYTYTDDNYKGGSVALFISNLPTVAPGAQATFAHLAIFPVT
jgi:hypothetical protein